MLELLLSLAPKRGGVSVGATPLFGEFNQPASTVSRRRPDRDQAVPFQKTDHLPHRRAFDVEPFGEGIYRSASSLVENRQRQELRDTQACRLEMRVIEPRDAPARLPHGVAVAIVDPKRLVDLLHFHFSRLR